MTNKNMIFNKPIINKNSYVGRTYKVSDNDLPHTNENSNKIVNFAVIEENGKKVGGVRTTTKKTKNATPFIPRHRVYKGYKSFLVTKFQNGDTIVVDDKRLEENPWKNNLSYENVNNVRNRLYFHSKQSVQNRKNRDSLKVNKKK